MATTTNGILEIVSLLVNAIQAVMNPKFMAIPSHACGQYVTRLRRGYIANLHEI
jgi:hypothetical protein